MNHVSMIDRSDWLQQQYAATDPKDFDARKAVALAYSVRFGYSVSLHRCTPLYGPDTGRFVGYNIAEVAPGEGVFFKRERVA